MNVPEKMQEALKVLQAKGCKCGGSVMLEGRDLKCSTCDLQVELGQPGLTEFYIETEICNLNGTSFKMLTDPSPHAREVHSLYSSLSLRLRHSNGMLPPGSQEKLTLYRYGLCRTILEETTVTSKA